MPSCLDNFKGMGTSFLSGTSLDISAMLIHLTLPLASEVSVSLAIRTLQTIKLHREVRKSKGDAEPGTEADASLFLHLCFGKLKPPWLVMWMVICKVPMPRNFSPERSLRQCIRSPGLSVTNGAPKNSGNVFSLSFGV